MIFPCLTVLELFGPKPHAVLFDRWSTLASAPNICMKASLGFPNRAFRHLIMTSDVPPFCLVVEDPSTQTEQLNKEQDTIDHIGRGTPQIMILMMWNPIAKSDLLFSELGGY